MCCKKIYLIVKLNWLGGITMQSSKQQIMQEIEGLRLKLNEKVANNKNRMPDLETMNLSRRMDELLNKLNSKDDIY